jgi:hypothetical protein
LSREIEFKFQVPRLFSRSKAILHAPPRTRGEAGLARSYDEALSMRGSVMRENRETLRSPLAMASGAVVGSLRT